MNGGYLQYSIANAISKALPRRFAYWIGLRVADRAYRMDVKGRTAVIHNLRQIARFKGRQASQETLEKLARRTFQYYGKYLVDFFRCVQMGKSEVDRTVSLQHLEHLHEARSAGKGVIALSAHFGNWELGGAVMASLDCPVHAVFMPERDARTRALFQMQRRRRGIKGIPLGSPVSQLLQALRQKAFVALLADRNFSDHHGPFTFFGAPARLPRGPATLAVRTGAPVLPAFILREADDTFLMRFHPPIVAERGTRVAEVQQRICAVLEQEIGSRPEQWFMFERFWPEESRGADATGGA